MSVYTPINKEMFKSLLSEYDLGHLLRFEGIRQGISNTIYRLETSSEPLIFTLFEHVQADKLNYFIDLLNHLHTHDVCCPQPIADKTGRYIHQLRDKPCMLTHFIPGKTTNAANAEQCAAVGAVLAKLHRAGQSFTQKRDNPRNRLWQKNCIAELSTQLAKSDRDLLNSEINYHIQHTDHHNLPHGLIHADLFRDNIIFIDNTLTGILDFFYACNDNFLLDVAITANDWCLNDNKQFDTPRLRAFLQAYHQHRPFEADEIELWPNTLRAAALRFWISRLADALSPLPGALVTDKDPNEYKIILQQHITAMQNGSQTFSQMLDHA